MDDSQHSIKLARAKLLYVDKWTPYGCGIMCLQDFENIRTDLTSGLTKCIVNPNGKKNVDDALAMRSEKACRVLFSQSWNLTTTVYSYMSKKLYDTINLYSDELPLKRKVLLCGMTERVSLG